MWAGSNLVSGDKSSISPNDWPNSPSSQEDRDSDRQDHVDPESTEDGEHADAIPLVPTSSWSSFQPPESQVRQRKRAIETPKQPRIKQIIQSVDLFPKVQEESRVATSTGLVSTVITLIIIAILFVSELAIFYSSKTTERMTVDTLPSERLPIYFDIEFPAIPCSQAVIEVMDVTGALHEVTFDHVTKQRTKNMVPITKPMSAYEETYQRILNPEEADEGCRLRGHIVVTKVAGNFHVALGAVIVTKSRLHIHNFSGQQLMTYNASHIIHELDFGHRFSRKASYTAQPTLSQSPLSGVRFITEKGSNPVNVRYYIKVVPTTFTSEVTGRSFNTNQYTYVPSINYIDPHKPIGGGIPGVFFVYDFSPYRILVTESPGYTRIGFLVTMCALVAGVMTIARAVDAFVYYISQSCCKKT